MLNCDNCETGDSGKVAHSSESGESGDVREYGDSDKTAKLAVMTACLSGVKLSYLSLTSGQWMFLEKSRILHCDWLLHSV